MRFRPCIDIHNGAVKQIVGSSLRDSGDHAKENYVAEKDAAWFASFYRENGLKGGHVILLNPASSPYYEATKQQALAALAAYPGGLMIGGGINEQNGEEFLRAGASHLIVTSFLFPGGRLSRERLRSLCSAYGKEHLVIDLSCRRRPGPENQEEVRSSVRAGRPGWSFGKPAPYYVVTDRWQTFTDCEVTYDLLSELSGSCDEFLIHGVDVEGKGAGLEENLVRLLGKWAAGEGSRVTYAGGISSVQDIRTLGRLSEDALDFTVGSALDLFGGDLKLSDVLRECGR